MGQILSLEEKIKQQATINRNAHLILVDGMSKLMTRKVEKFVSSDFHIGGLKWSMILFPEEDHLSYGVMISDSKCIGSNWKVNCTLKFTLWPVPSASLVQRVTFVDSACFDEKRRTNVAKISFSELKEKFTADDKSAFSAEITYVRPHSLNVTSVPRTIGTAERIKPLEVQRNNSRFTWKITHFSSFAAGELHSSYHFTVGPRRWFLEMCPKGILEGKGNSLSLYLHAAENVTDGPKTKTLAVFKLRVLDQLKRNHHEIECHDCFSADSRSGSAKFLALEELHKPSNGFLVNDQIYVGVEFLFVSTSENMIT